MSFTAGHGEFFLDVASCTRCFCDDGQATLCEPAVCPLLSATPTSCQFNGQEYEHGKQFVVSHIYNGISFD